MKFTVSCLVCKKEVEVRDMKIEAIDGDSQEWKAQKIVNVLAEFGIQVFLYLDCGHFLMLGLAGYGVGKKVEFTDAQKALR